jgi:hypothetical protein
MKRATLLYAAFVAAAIVAIIGIPWLVHSRGSDSVPGWSGFVSPGPLSPAHQSLEGKCTSCHTPHKGVEAKTCLTCHAGEDFADQQSARFHADAKQCTSCHVEHDGGKSLVKMDHDVLLMHRQWAQAADQRRSERVQSRDPLKALNCASCHSNRDPHAGLFGKTCSSCHSLDSWTVADFRHPVPTNQECSQCHKPPPSHLMGHFEMVSQAQARKTARVDQCQACHMTDSWNNIRGTGFYDNH